ncbi:MAG: KH domain-containing protein [Oscillospiraceae bacterium]|nr:KH domain-containing protein [Oscillospiraceae bacterium]
MTEIFAVKKMEQAKKLAAEKFGVSEDLIVFRVLEEKKGLFGKMKVEAIYEAPEAPKTAAPAKRAAAAPPIVEIPDVLGEEYEEKKAEPVAEEAAEEEDIAVSEDDEITEADEENAVLIPEDEMPENLAAARAYIIAIYEKMGVSVNVAVSRTHNGILMNVTSDVKSGTIIGRRGETLDSIQYLASIIANRGREDYSRIMLDSNGYRVKRRKTLEQLADKISRNVIRSGRSTTLEPMNPYERRIIHSRIAEVEGVVSHSVGEDPYRKVVVAPVGGSRRGGRNDNRNRSGNNRGGRRPYREKRPEDFKPSNLDNMKTSFEKDYKKPKPEDEMNFTTGLYGKIEL